jgi:hypothetical protein
LDAIEKAIRNAFEKGDAEDRAFRERVYRSAFAALDRALKGNPVSPEAAEKRRRDLQATIAVIETEFIPAVFEVETPAEPPAIAPAEPPAVAPAEPPAVAPAEPAGALAPGDGQHPGEAPAVELDRRTPMPAAPAAGPAVAAPGEPVAPPSVDPVLDIRPAPERPADPAAARRVEPAVAAPETSARAAERLEPRLAGDPEIPRPEEARPVPEAFFPDAADFGPVGAPVARPEDATVELSAGAGPNVATERRRPLAAAFFGVTLLALVGIGVWWALSTGLIKLPGAPDTDDITVVPPDEDYTPGEEEAPQKPGEADAKRGWIAVFAPADPTTVSAPSDTKADVMSDDSGSFVRIRSGASGSAIVFDVSKGALEQIAGKHATFDIIARGAEDKETQFSVDCNFGELGDCGRKRYQAGFEKNDFLFDIDLPGKAPGAAGTIAIDSDVDNGGKALDVYEIKVSVVE